MEEFFSYICEHAHQAPWIIFSLLLLSGFNIPISEDLLLLGGGAIASTCIPNHTLKLYLWVFFGSYLSAWESYWIGRLLGPRLYHLAPFRWILTPQRLDSLRHYYAKFGILTFIVGRFCPGGIRNALFLSSGLTKMPFPLFILRDGLACLLSSSILFSLGYYFGQNFDLLIFYFNRYTHWFLGIFFSLIAMGSLFLGYRLFTKNKRNNG